MKQLMAARVGTSSSPASKGEIERLSHSVTKRRA